jgi:hypothetical protein
VLHDVRVVRHHTGDQNLALGQFHIPPEFPFVLVALRILLSTMSRRGTSPTLRPWPSAGIQAVRRACLRAW